MFWGFEAGQISRILLKKMGPLACLLIKLLTGKEIFKRNSIFNFRKNKKNKKFLNHRRVRERHDIHFSLKSGIWKRKAEGAGENFLYCG